MSGSQSGPLPDVEQANHEIDRRSEELRRLAVHLQRTQEDERARVARQLHDELGGLFTAAKLDATRIRMKLGELDPDVAERLTHLIDLLNMGVKFKRRLIEELTPSSLRHLGLVPALELLIDEQTADAALTAHQSLTNLSLTPTATMTAYRVVEEALANVRRHAEASTVSVTVAPDGDQARIEVADDGRGFVPSQVAEQCYGLLAMRYRVESEGGQLTIDSAPGKGTRLLVRLPLSGFSAGLS